MTRPVARRLAAVALAMALVVAAIGGGLAPSPAEPAQAVELFPDCSWFASTYLGFTQMVFRTVTGDETGCRVDVDLFPDHSSAAMNDVYTGAVTLHESQATALAAINNRLVDARAPAYTEAKLAMVNELNAGGNESEVRNASHEAIEDFYSPMVVNLNALWVQKVAYWNYSWEAEAQSHPSGHVWVGGQSMNLEPDGSWYRVNLTDRQLTLPNGTTVPTKAIHGPDASSGETVEVHFGGSDKLSGDFPTELSNANDNAITYMHGSDFTVLVFMEAPVEGSGETWQYDTYDPDLNPPSGVHEPEHRIEYHYDQVYAEIAQVKANIDQLVNDTVANYSEGELDTSDVLSPVELASRASTDYNSTGYYAFHAAQLAMMGYAGNISHSHVVDYNGSVYNGTLFYTGDDLTELETGVTYDPTAFAGDFVLAYQVDGNESAVLDLEGNFTIIEQTDTRTGEVVTTTAIEEYTYATTNSSDLADELERLSEAREEMVDQGLTLNVGGGGLLDGIATFLGNLFGGTSMGLLLVGAAVVVFLLGRES